MNQQRIGVVGMGTMGVPMAANMARSGLPVMVYNRTLEKTALPEEAGALVAKSPQDLFAWAGAVVLMLAGPEAIDDVLLADSSALRLLKGKLVVNMGTVAPAYSKALSARLEDLGIAYVEAPVFGSRKPAEDGTLVVLTAGDSGLLEGLLPVFGAVGKKTVHCGAVPAGMATKIATNLLLAAHTEALAEALHFVEKAGGNPATYMDIVLSGPLASDFYRMKAPKFLNRDFSPQASIVRVAETMHYVVETAQETDAFTPGAAMNLRLNEKAIALGIEDEDMTAIIKALESRPIDE